VRSSARCEEGMETRRVLLAALASFQGRERTNTPALLGSSSRQKSRAEGTGGMCASERTVYEEGDTYFRYKIRCVRPEGMRAVTPHHPSPIPRFLSAVTTLFLPNLHSLSLEQTSTILN
jgi:hypothetical protein